MVSLFLCYPVAGRPVAADPRRLGALRASPATPQLLRPTVSVGCDTFRCEWALHRWWWDFLGRRPIHPTEHLFGHMHNLSNMCSYVKFMRSKSWKASPPEVGGCLRRPVSVIVSPRHRTYVWS
jgi:hypothetical protein